MPSNKDGKTYCLAGVVEWLLSRERDSATAEHAMQGSDSPALERYRMARAEAAELDLWIKKGSLIELTEVTDAWTRRVGETATNLQHLAYRLAAVLPGQDARRVAEIVEDEVFVMQTVFARHGKYCEVAEVEFEILDAHKKAMLEFIYTGIGYGNSANRRTCYEPSMEYTAWRSNYLKGKEKSK